MRTTIRRIITGPSVITLRTVPETATIAVIIATTVEIIAVDVDARGAGVGHGVVHVALAVGVRVVGAAVGRTEVAVSVRVSVAVHPPTHVVPIANVSRVEPADILHVLTVKINKYHVRVLRTHTDMEA